MTKVAQQLEQCDVSTAQIAGMIQEEHGLCLRKCCIAENIMELFQVLMINNCFTFFNPSLFMDILNKFGDEKCVYNLRLYQARFQGYCRRRLCDVSSSPSSLHCKQFESSVGCDHSELGDKLSLCFIIDQKYTDATLEDLKNFQCRVAKALGINQSTFHFVSVEEGSMIINYRIPRQVAKTLIESVELEVMSQFFQSEKVKSAMINEKVIFQLDSRRVSYKQLVYKQIMFNGPLIIESCMKHIFHSASNQYA